MSEMLLVLGAQCNWGRLMWGSKSFLSYSVKLISSSSSSSTSSFSAVWRICASSPTTKYVSLERTLSMMIMGNRFRDGVPLGLILFASITRPHSHQRTGTHTETREQCDTIRGTITILSSFLLFFHRATRNVTVFSSLVIVPQLRAIIHSLQVKEEDEKGKVHVG